jgi:hypothetical protein
MQKTSRRELLTRGGAVAALAVTGAVVAPGQVKADPSETEIRRAWERYMEAACAALVFDIQHDITGALIGNEREVIERRGRRSALEVSFGKPTSMTRKLWRRSTPAAPMS